MVALMAETAFMPVLSEIPDKLYFRIGEVSKLTGVKPYVLRFWESEFPGLGPKKSGTGHRLYRRKDVEMVLEIKHLLYDKRYTIEGARKWLETRGRSDGQKVTSKAAVATQGELFPQPVAPGLDQIRAELKAILDILR
jgi:DNA-binding transcriptional MerR regulator